MGRRYSWRQLAMARCSPSTPMARVLRPCIVSGHFFPNFTSSDGADPYAGLILSGNTLYGTTSGGSWGDGTVFAINTDGIGFTNLHSFTGSLPLISGRSVPGRFGFIGQHPVWDGRCGRRVLAPARCSPSTPMARVLRTCIVSRQLSVILIIPTATERPRVG